MDVGITWGLFQEPITKVDKVATGSEILLSLKPETWLYLFFETSYQCVNGVFVSVVTLPDLPGSHWSCLFPLHQQLQLMDQEPGARSLLVLLPPSLSQQYGPVVDLYILSLLCWPSL